MFVVIFVVVVVVVVFVVVVVVVVPVPVPVLVLVGGRRRGGVAVFRTVVGFVGVLVGPVVGFLGRIGSFVVRWFVGFGTVGLLGLVCCCCVAILLGTFLPALAALAVDFCCKA